jgi:hypothetical protein
MLASVSRALALTARRGVAPARRAFSSSKPVQGDGWCAKQCAGMQTVI